MATDDNKSKDEINVKKDVGRVDLGPGFFSIVNNHVGAWQNGDVKKAMEGVKEEFLKKAKEVEFSGSDCYDVQEPGWVLKFDGDEWFIGLVKVSKQTEIPGSEYWASIKVFKKKEKYSLEGFIISPDNHLQFIVNGVYVFKPSVVLVDAESKTTNLTGGVFKGLGHTYIVQDLKAVQQVCNDLVGDIRQKIGVSKDFKFDNFVVEQAFSKVLFLIYFRFLCYM